MKFCTKCGKQLNDDAKFCDTCGAPVSGSQTPPIPGTNENVADGSYAFNFSTVQKYFNMMCKYYWCAGFIEEPPELPVDRINLSKIGKKDSWTKGIITKSNYEKVMRTFVRMKVF
ncbi:MAG: zinc-ribbon domain-containing protein [Treponema sp.]